jgi:hypothetical protein
MTHTRAHPQPARCLLTLVLLWAGNVWAGEVIITMPDAHIQSALSQICSWWHCWKNGATYPSDTALANSVIDQMVSTVSLGHYSTLAYLHGTLEIRYDYPREPIGSSP